MTNVLSIIILKIITHFSFFLLNFAEHVTSMLIYKGKNSSCIQTIQFYVKVSFLTEMFNMTLFSH